MSNSKHYKIWAVIEELDEENDAYEDVSEPALVGEYDTLEEARSAWDGLDLYS